MPIIPMVSISPLIMVGVELVINENSRFSVPLKTVILTGELGIA